MPTALGVVFAADTAPFARSEFFAAAGVISGETTLLFVMGLLRTVYLLISVDTTVRAEAGTETANKIIAGNEVVGY